MVVSLRQMAPVKIPNCRQKHQLMWEVVGGEGGVIAEFLFLDGCTAAGCVVQQNTSLESKRHCIKENINDLGGDRHYESPRNSEKQWGKCV